MRLRARRGELEAQNNALRQQIAWQADPNEDPEVLALKVRIQELEQSVRDEREVVAQQVQWAHIIQSCAPGSTVRCVVSLVLVCHKMAHSAEVCPRCVKFSCLGPGLFCSPIFCCVLPFVLGRMLMCSSILLCCLSYCVLLCSVLVLSGSILYSCPLPRMSMLDAC